MKHLVALTSAIILTLTFFTSCKKDSPVPEDVITSECESAAQTMTDTITESATDTITGEGTETADTDGYSESHNTEYFTGGNRDTAYESDLVFVGDSICSGFRVYSGLLDDDQVYAVGNIGSWCLFDYTFKVNGGTYTPVEVIKRRQPKYIYLWMGMNDINIIYKEKYAKNLKEISDKFLEVSPYSKIVFVSITPINKIHPWCEKGKFDYDINERIDSFNSYTEKYVEGLNDDRFSYLFIHDLFVDENGYLKDEYHSGDGLHLAPECYRMILEYIAQHEVEYDGDFPVVTTPFPVITTTPPQTTAQTTEITMEETTSGEAEITAPDETTTTIE